jgi:hypothetical protein
MAPRSIRRRTFRFGAGAGRDAAAAIFVIRSGQDEMPG